MPAIVDDSGARIGARAVGACHELVGTFDGFVPDSVDLATEEDPFVGALAAAPVFVIVSAGGRSICTDLTDVRKFSWVG